MLSENIKTVRKMKGLSQEELAIRLNVVRQTISKWEQGLSVPDADLLIRLAEELETPVGTLLGENIAEEKADDLKTLAEKLETVNLQLAREKERRRRALFWLCIALCAVTAAGFTAFLLLGGTYLGWDLSDPETAVAAAALHAAEFVFVRLAPFLLIGSAVGACLTRKRK